MILINSPAVPPPPPVQSLGHQQQGATTYTRPAALATTASCTDADNSCASPVLTSQGMEVLSELKDLRACINAIPSREDMDMIVARLEKAYCAELSTLRANVQKNDSQVQSQANKIQSIQSDVFSHQQSLDAHAQQIHYLTEALDDAENRGRRNNLRIRGLPEEVDSRDLPRVLQRVFNKILDAPPANEIELDRAHRALGPRSSDPNRPRDVICRVHHYVQKEAIQQKLRDGASALFQKVKLQILPDLSRLTLQRRRALRPLLDLLRAHNLHSWGFPFRLQKH
ncbi:uncharacterized protein ACNLHF_012161 [Anomaloglossus baeobatrachus]